MADKTHENRFYFVANAQLFDNSEQTEMSPMSNTAVNIAAAFTQIIGYYRVITIQMYSSMSTITLNKHEYKYTENKCTRVRLL